MPVPRPLARALVAVVLAAVPRLAVAQSTPESNQRGLPAWEPLHIDLGVRTLAIADLTFSGSGHYPGSDGTSTVTVNGRSLGAGHIPLFSAEIRPEVMVGRHVALGLALGIAGTSVDTSGSAAAQQVLLGSALTVPRLGATIDFVWLRGPIEVRTSATAGVQVAMLPIRGFAAERCGRSVCYPSATATTPFVEPRVSVAFHHGPWMFGVYGALEYVPSVDGAAGLMLGVDDSRWSHGAGFEPEHTETEPLGSHVTTPVQVVDLHADGSVTVADDASDWHR